MTIQGYMWRSGTKKKARAVLAISWRCCEIQGREEALSRGAGLLESQQEENLDLMRRQQGGELGRRMNFVTSINQAAQQMEHFRRHSHSHHQRPGEEQHRLGCVALCSHEDLTSLFKLRTESCCNAVMQGATQRASCSWLMFFFFFVFLLLAV